MRYFYLVIAAFAYLAFDIVSSDSCVQCNSSNDTKCAIYPEKFLAKECTNTSSKCYSRVLNGITIRGCASDLDNGTAANCNNEMDCLTCSFSEGCNRNVFPTHRAQCLQCTGNGTGLCASDTFRRPMVCPLYELGDKCFIRKANATKSSNATFTRGCLSSAKQLKLCTNNDCYTCEGIGCNYIPADSNEIPWARASAGVLNYSLYLLVICAALKFFH